MTAQEAIKVIKTNFCDECIMTSCENCAQGKAKEALEKQIPKKPDKTDDGSLWFGYPVVDICYNCPVCNSFIGYEADCKDEYYQIPYCQGCGQKFDWPEEN